MSYINKGRLENLGQNIRELSHVVDRLNKTLNALNDISFSRPNYQLISKSKLEFTEEWFEREADLYSLFIQYKEIIRKNIEDAKLMVQLIPEQNESIIHDFQTESEVV